MSSSDGGDGILAGRLTKMVSWFAYGVPPAAIQNYKLFNAIKNEMRDSVRALSPFRFAERDAERRTVNK